MNREVFEWLDAWWHIAGGVADEPHDATTDNPWKWEGHVYRAATLPEECAGIDIRPLKRFLRAVVALGDPSPINGPLPTKRELQALSSEAWAAYQSLHVQRDTIEGGVPESPTDAVEIGPFEPKWLRIMFSVDDNRTLKLRLGNAQREVTQRSWFVPRAAFVSAGDWKHTLRKAAESMPANARTKLETFLSLQ